MRWSIAEQRRACLLHFAQPSVLQSGWKAQSGARILDPCSYCHRWYYRRDEADATCSWHHRFAAAPNHKADTWCRLIWVCCRSVFVGRSSFQYTRRPPVNYTMITSSTSGCEVVKLDEKREVTDIPMRVSSRASKMKNNISLVRRLVLERGGRGMEMCDRNRKTEEIFWRAWSQTWHFE